MKGTTSLGVFLPQLTLRIKKEKVFFGPGIASLLECIENVDNVRRASESMGISYSKAWKILRTAEDELGILLVERRQGGKDGGHAGLTKRGKALLTAYRAYDADVHAYAISALDKHFNAIEEATI